MVRRWHPPCNRMEAGSARVDGVALHCWGPFGSPRSPSRDRARRSPPRSFRRPGERSIDVIQRSECGRRCKLPRTEASDRRPGHLGKAGERPCRGLRCVSIPDPRVRAAFVGLICPSGPPGQGCETNCPSAGRSSGSWVFPAPSLAFCRHRPGLRGLPGTRAAHRPKPMVRKPS
jgi:hypothetical protein